MSEPLYITDHVLIRNDRPDTMCGETQELAPSIGGVVVIRKLCGECLRLCREWENRELNPELARKLDDLNITKVWRAIDGKWACIWEKQNGKWVPVHKDTYYDKKEN